VEVELTMAAESADVTLIDDPVARELLDSTQVARLAYTWTDGTPRVVPVWFHYDGEVITMGTPAGAPSVRGPTRRWLIRGRARVASLPLSA
jgi:hypothetical protein